MTKHVAIDVWVIEKLGHALAGLQYGEIVLRVFDGRVATVDVEYKRRLAEREVPPLAQETEKG